MSDDVRYGANCACGQPAGHNPPCGPREIKFPDRRFDGVDLLNAVTDERDAAIADRDRYRDLLKRLVSTSGCCRMLRMVSEHVPDCAYAAALAVLKEKA